MSPHRDNSCAGPRLMEFSVAPSKLLFDEPYYIEINEARWKVVSELLASVRRVAPIGNVLDLGCGPGWFSRRLVDSGLEVLGLDARRELVEEAQRRAPEARFRVFDFDASALEHAPERHDAVLAFGLLYHLENPLRALRMFRASARHALLMETMTVPEAGPVGRLVAENPNETQGVRNLALMLSPDAIVCALSHVGFSYVYRYCAAVDHPDFFDTAERHKRRNIFLATDLPIDDPTLELQSPPRLGRYDFSIRQ